VRAELDALDVAAQYGAGPDVGALVKNDVADQHRG